MLSRQPRNRKRLSISTSSRISDGWTLIRALANRLRTYCEALYDTSWKKSRSVMKRVISPLRYPGSKVRITEMVAGLLEQNLLVGCHLYEPFAGGSAVSLALLANGFVPSATWIERDPMIYAFWKMVKDQPEPLIDRMMKSKVSLRAWKLMLPLRDIKRLTQANLPALGYAGLFFNRTCFSGIIGAGPIGGITQASSSYKIDCRFNKKELAAAIRNCSAI